jgi:hypothetical protein
VRWGISREAALDQSTTGICRAEIACYQAVKPRPDPVVGFEAVRSIRENGFHDHF